MFSVNIAIITPFIFAITILILNKMFPRVHLGWFTLLAPASLFVFFASFLKGVSNGETYTQILRWIPTYGINFSTRVDGLSIIFGLLITGIGSLVILYSIYYLSRQESLRHFYVYLLLFMGGMLGVVFSDHLMVLYVFWELTSISSFLLIAFWFHRKQSRYGAQKSLLITVTGGFAMLAGFIMIYLMTGTFTISEIVSSYDTLTNHILFVPAMLLVLLGAFTKSAQFPFHIWLPDAMEAPTPVSAYLHSATMVKAGIYIVARFTPFFGGHEVWFWLVSGIGLVTLFWGSFTAVRQVDLKALLAYSTISQLGLIMSLLGIGSAALFFSDDKTTLIYTQATFAALFHLINHATFKGALFMVVGIVDLKAGTRDLRRLGGLMAVMPVSFTIALVGSFSMAGLPPFNGFLSKEMFFTAMLSAKQLTVFSMETWGILFPIIAWLASVFTFIYSMMIVFHTFFGKGHFDKLERKPGDAKIGMVIAPAILASFVVLIFFYPNIVGQYLVKPAMASVYPLYADSLALGVQISAWHEFNTELLMTIAIIIVGTILFMTLKKWSRIYEFFPNRYSLDTFYNNTLMKTESGARKVTNFYMTGLLRHYLIYIYIFFIVAVGGLLLLSGAFTVDMSGDAPISAFEAIIVGVMVVAGIAMLFAKSRVTAILLNGVLGFSIAALFVLFRAPDLALTQLVIEAVTTALFLLCFHFLPVWKNKNEKRDPLNIPNAVIAIGVGTVFTLVALSVQSGRMFETIATYFERAEELAGGQNIVNAILGDFRAFDTMLEVVVLFIGGIAVYSLIKFKQQRKGGLNVED